jgi:hypothetical protein
MNDEGKVVRFISREEAIEEAKEESHREYVDPLPYSEVARECKSLSNLSESGNGKSRISIPRTFNREEIKTAFDDAFQLVGGVPRLAHWADENYGEFIKLYARMLPTSAKSQMELTGGITINHVLPRGPLDE